MKYEEYISLIKKAEDAARTNKRSYERKVLGLALLGYGYFWALLILGIALPCVILIAIYLSPLPLFKTLMQLLKFWWLIIPIFGAFFGFVGGALKAAFTKFPEPEGAELERSQAPELFSFIDSTCKSLKADPPSKVLITSEFNASVASLPRFGLFGRKVYLMLGLPLMKSLAVDQFNAVLTHEIGHISGKHGIFATWAYQVREVWSRLIGFQELTESKVSFLYDRFVNWFFPYFTAYSFPLSREHEKEADQYAVQLSGSKALAESLVILEVTNHALNDGFWRELHLENQKSGTASEKIFSRMMEAIGSIDPKLKLKELTKSLSIETTYEDSHPSLKERLTTLNYLNSDGTADIPDAPVVTSFDAYLKDSASQFVEGFESSWGEYFAADWSRRHNYYQKNQKRIDELEAKTSDILTPDEYLEKANLVIEKDGYEAGLQVMVEANERYGENGMIAFNLGVLHLYVDNEDGLEHLKRAALLDKTFAISAKESTFNYLHSKGRTDEAAAVASLLDSEYEEINLAERERKGVWPTDTLLEYNASPELLQLIPKKIAGIDEITAIYLAKKAVQYYKDVPYVVMFVDVRARTLLKNRDDLSAYALTEMLTERFAGTEINGVVVLTEVFESFKPTLTKMEGAKVFG